MDTGPVMKTKYLTDEERKAGRRLLYRFQALNGIGFNFMGATPVYLLAIHFGAGNLELGYISSVMFLTGIILVALPRLLSGRNLVAVQSTAWLFRGSVVLLYLFLFFLKGRSAVLLILVVYTLFSIVRTIGIAVWNPLVKMVSDPGIRGEVIAQGNILNQSAAVVSKLVSFFVTSITCLSGITGIIILQILGVFFNTAAALSLKKIPCRETVEYRKGRNIFVVLRSSLKNRERKYPLILKWTVVSLIVLNGLIIPFIRKEAGFQSNFVFLYSLVMAVSVIFSGFFSKIFADRIGSRPLLIGMSILLALSFLFWAVLPVKGGEGNIPVVIYYVLGFFTNFFLMTSNVLVSRVVVNTMPEDETFGYNSMINFMMALFSAGSGFLGGTLIDAGQRMHLPVINSYGFLFVLAIFLSLAVTFLSIRLIDRGSLTTRQAAAIFFSFEGLRAYIDIGKMKNTSNPVKKKTVLLSISENEAPFVTEELKKILALPLSASKGEVIKSLFSHPRPELLPELLAEARDSGSYHQLKAIFALGAYPSPDVEELLLQLFQDTDSAVRSNAAKSLGRIGNTTVLPLVRSMADRAESSWDRINYLIALKNMDDSGMFLENLFDTGAKGPEGTFRQTYYALCADLYGMAPSLSALYQACNLTKGKGIQVFLESTRDHERFYRYYQDLKKWFKEEKGASVRAFCRESLRDLPDEAETGYKTGLRNGILRFTEREKTVYDDMCAAVYFTYQILTDRG